MSDRKLVPVIDGYTFLEAPRWHDGRLWLSDFYTHKVIAVTPGGDVEDIASVPQQPSGLGGCPTARCSSSRCGTASSSGSTAVSWSSTPTCPRRPAATSTTWSSTVGAAPTSATSAST